VRLVAAAATAIFVLSITFDFARPPAEQWTARLAIGAIHVYQEQLSPWMPALGVRCRFEPTCSHYAEASIRRHGTLVGGWRSLVRIVRCGPWTPSGTFDPPGD
jgi:uncharacterized protein